MSEDFWIDEAHRRLDGNEASCCLCLTMNEQVEVEEEEEDEDGKFASINADSQIQHNHQNYCYRRIIDDCFRIEIARDSSLVVCRACRLLLKQTCIFFLRIRSAQLKLQRNIDEKPPVLENINEDTIPLDVIVNRIKRESSEVEENFNYFNIDEGDVVKFKSESKIGENGECSTKTHRNSHKTHKKSKERKSRLIYENAAEPFVEIREKKSTLRGRKPRKKLKIPVQSPPKPYRFKCVCCPDKFQLISELKTHISIEHGEKFLKSLEKPKKPYRFKCVCCADKFQLVSQLQAHISKIHGEEYLKSWEKMQVESRKNAKSIPYRFEGTELTCHICRETFPIHKNLVQHMSAHYPNYVCDVCGKSFVQKHSLQVHLQYTHSQESHACDSCAKLFKTELYLKRHRSTAHGIGDPCLTRCPKCPERFTSHRNRLNHLIEAHGEEPPKYECKLCPKQFRFSGMLTDHVKRCHLQQKNHPCPECNLRWYSKYELDKHMLVHAGIKNFKCEKCGKCFGKKNTLVEHIKSHDNIRNHACNICKKAFVQKCTLKEHMKVHEKCHA